MAKKKKIDIAGELNATTVEGIVANAKQIRLGDDNSEAVAKDLGTFEENPEYIRVYTDKDGRFLWGIKTDGNIEWAKGVPKPIQKKLEKLETELKEQDKELATIINEKIGGLQNEIDAINVALKVLTDTFSYQKNGEFAYVMTDADGKVLFGFRQDGTPYFPKNEMYNVIENEEFLYAITDAQGKLLFGIRNDGEIIEGKIPLKTRQEIEHVKTELSRNVLAVEMDRATGRIIGHTGNDSRIKSCVQDRVTGIITINQVIE